MPRGAAVLWCTAVFPTREANIGYTELVASLGYRYIVRPCLQKKKTKKIPGGEPMSLPDTSDPGNFLFRIGTIFSSKYSMAMEEISRNSCSTSWAR